MSKKPQLPVLPQFKQKLTHEQKIRLNRLIDEFSKLGETLNIQYFYHDSLVNNTPLHNPKNYPLVDYIKQFNLSPDDLPIFAVMVSSDKLHFANDDRYFVPLHSVCAIADLQVAGSETLIINELYRCHTYDDDYLSELAPFCLAKFGREAFDNFVNASNQLDDPFAKSIFQETFKIIAQTQPKNREPAIDVLVKSLQDFANHDKTYNSFLINSLVDLKANEHSPLIKQAFDADCVDLSVQGDYEEVEILFGIRQQRSTPRPEFWGNDDEWQALRALFQTEQELPEPILLNQAIQQLTK